MVASGIRVQIICVYVIVLAACLSQITVAQAEDVFYDKYNLLNEDNRYDMICKDETPIGTRIPVRLMDYDRLSKKYAEDREKKFE